MANFFLNHQPTQRSSRSHLIIASMWPRNSNRNSVSLPATKQYIKLFFGILPRLCLTHTSNSPNEVVLDSMLCSRETAPWEIIMRKWFSGLGLSHHHELPDCYWVPNTWIKYQWHPWCCCCLPARHSKQDDMWQKIITICYIIMDPHNQ